MERKHDTGKISESFLGLRLEHWLADSIQQCAKNQHRSKSNWVRLTLEQAIERQPDKRHVTEKTVRK